MSAEKARPHFQNSIAQLETIFRTSQSDPEILRLLDHELSFRTTDRAARLRAGIANALATEPASKAPPGKAPERSEARSSRQPSTAPDPFAGKAAPSSIASLPPILAFGDLPSVATPDHDNMAAGMLAAWTALEALSPQTYRRPEDLASGDRSCVADLSRGQVPWGKGERSRPKRQLYYQVILGAIPMDRATEDLVKAFGADEVRSTRQREKAAIGAVLVDKNGVLLEDNSISVSSFAWALPLALKLKLGALGAWPRIEPRIIGALENILRRTDDAGNPVPLDLATIDQAHRWLVAQFGLPAVLVEPPSFALRVFHYFKARNPPEVSLLNSFFMGDLSKAVDLCAKGELPGGLRQYLGMDAPSRTIDLFSDTDALEAAVAPARTPAARWPSPGGHPLVLLQQAAVNLARSALADGGGVIAVNGPPGTGKTTLLRDIVAATVLDRAMAMASFDDPAKAFTPSGERQAFGPKAFFHLYVLDPSLKGHEMLVASSNNKAVENVSRELPAAKAVGRSTDDISYFKSISDLVYSPRASTEDDDGPAVPMEPADTWGLIAAVLGNARNRAAFQQSFWWHEDWGFRTYLKAAKGDPVVQEIKDPETGKIIERRTPPVVLAEQPPSPAFALRNWYKARDRLLTLKQTVDGRLAALEAVRILCVRLAETRKAIARDEAELAQTRSRRPDLEADRANRQIDVENAARVHGERSAAIAAHRTERPVFFSRLFRTARWAAWTSTQAPLVAAQAQARTALRAVERAFAEADAALAALDQDIAGRETRLAAPRAVATQLASEIDRHRPELGDRIIDDAFFARGHEASNLEAPWINDAVHRLREDLFIAALDVHKAFIDASAQKMLHNLSVLMDFFSRGAPQDPAKKALLRDLWSTLFLVVPVISTTFASVERMLGDLPVGSIGWLLIDEAGQALPQAAVGAILRARRAIMVGDPLQIPPVVALPERLNAEICRHFRVDKPIWAAPEASAQTLADRASPYQAAFRSDQGSRRVGIPLLVHRRCQEPMFGISNRIAYDGQMVHAPGPRQSAIGRALGPSRWVDIDGEADSKWSPDEGEQVISLIRRIIDAGITCPDLFVITPFRIVAQEMRRRLEKERAMFAAAGVNIREWSNDRIGTIHTVQGREAEAVILVLGAPKASQNGARNWAAGTPNILNVAASRAKQHLYVVGSHGAWSGVGHARELAALPRERP